MKRLLAFFVIALLCLGIFCACDEGDTDVTPPAVCQHRDADDDSLCDKCGESYTDGTDVTPPAVCQHRDADDNSLCDKCGESYTDGTDVTPPAHTHEWGVWSVTTPATCQAKGVETRTCACGESETRDIEKNMDNHTAWGTWGVTTPATCRAKGEETRTCACGHSETRDIEKNMDNHTAWGNWGVTTPATCQAKGVETRSCACGESETREIGATGAHVYDQKVKESAYLKSEATADSPAIYHYSCTCGAKGSATFYDGYVLCYTLTLDYSFRVVSGLIGDATEIEIPRIFDGLRVVAIAAGAFQNNTTLQKITLPNTIEQIGQSAFAGCTALTDINLPTSISEIGKTAFKGCTALEHIEIPGSIATLPEALFQDCSKLKTVTVNEGVVTIGNLVFDNCKKLQSFTMPDTVTTLGNMAFRHAEGLVSISFSKNLTAIGNATFQYCVRLASVELHAGITTIGNSAFSYCDGLKTLRILGNIAVWGNSAFYECQGLTSIYLSSATTGDMGAENYIFYNAGLLGDGITLTLSPNAVVPERLFEPFEDKNCPKLTTVDIEDGATAVKAFAKYNHLPYLTEIRIPTTLHTISKNAFHNSLWWENQPDGAVCIDHLLYDIKNAASFTELTVPSDVTAFSFASLQDCVNLQSLTVPFVGGLAYTHFGYLFGASSFSNNNDYVPTSLKTVVITGGTSISQNAFRGCSNITSVTIPNSVTSIGSHAFRGCSNITSITIPNSVTSIGDDAFCACSGLESITLPFVGASSSASGYQSHFGYIFGYSRSSSSGNSYHYYDSSQSSNRYFAYYISTSLQSVTITNGITSIGSHAFYNCSGLMSITIPSSVTSIGSSAFYNCTGLTSITIPSSVTSIGSDAFYNCTGLTSITIPSSVTSIGSYAFYNCSGLTSVTIPNSVTFIGWMAFAGCSGLTIVYYGGTASQWSNISIDSGNGYLTDTARYYYSVETPTETGNYWYYDENGEIAIW